MDRRQASPPPATLPPPQPRVSLIPSRSGESFVRANFPSLPFFPQFLSPLHPPAPHFSFLPPLFSLLLPSPAPPKRGDWNRKPVNQTIVVWCYTSWPVSFVMCFLLTSRGFASFVTVFAILLSQMMISFLFSSNKNIRNGMYASCNRFKQNTNTFFFFFFFFFFSVVFFFFFLFFVHYRVLCKLKNKHKVKIRISYRRLLEHNLASWV